MNNIYTQKTYFPPQRVIPSVNLNNYGSTNRQPIHTKSVSYISPNYYSVEKTPVRNQGIKLDIQTLLVKNHRNFSSVDRVKDGYSDTSHLSSLKNSKPMTQPIGFMNYEIKKGYIDGFRERLPQSKVKKSSFRKG